MIPRKSIPEVLVAIELALLVASLVSLRHERTRAEQAGTAIQPGETISALAGFEAAGARYSLSPRAPCLLLRFAAASCASCEADGPNWRHLIGSPAARGCDLVTLAPNAGAVEPPHASPAGVHDLAYVGMGWFSAGLGLSAQPTTIIVGPRHEVVWYHAGVLPPGAADAAATALARARAWVER